VEAGVITFTIDEEGRRVDFEGGRVPIGMFTLFDDFTVPEYVAVHASRDPAAHPLSAAWLRARDEVMCRGLIKETS
jgi:hypothetical protein